MRTRRIVIGGVAAVMAAASALAQTPPPVVIQQAPPPPASPAPGSAIPPLGPPPSAPPAVAVPPPAAAPLAQAGRPTLIPNPGDPVNVDEVVLPEKPVLVVTGSSGWDDGLKSIRAAFARIEAELARLGLSPAGRPITVFLQTTDDEFRFEAMIPIAAAPNPPPSLSADFRFGVTPSGKAYRFVHKGAYDDIDSTYETITTYLDSKDIVAKDTFIEEYVNDVGDPADVGLEINIFVQPK